MKTVIMICPYQTRQVIAWGVSLMMGKIDIDNYDERRNLGLTTTMTQSTWKTSVSVNLILDDKKDV